MVWERRIALIYHWQLSVTANEEPAHVDNDEENDDDDDEEEEQHDDEDYGSRAPIFNLIYSIKISTSYISNS